MLKDLLAQTDFFLNTQTDILSHAQRSYGI